jgi:predicted kinase
VSGPSSPTLILVTGPAGSGKTTLAHELAGVVGCPVVSRDEIKEGMVASHRAFVAEQGDPLTLRTYGLFFEVIELLLSRGVTLVAEAAFQHALWWRRLEPLTGVADLKVVRCQVPEAVARQRMLTRMVAQSTRAAHADADHLATAGSFRQLTINGPTLDVDTADGWRPDLAEIVAFCRP